MLWHYVDNRWIYAGQFKLTVTQCFLRSQPPQNMTKKYANANDISNQSEPNPNITNINDEFGHFYVQYYRTMMLYKGSTGPWRALNGNEV